MTKIDEANISHNIAKSNTEKHGTVLEIWRFKSNTKIQIQYFCLLATCFFHHMSLSKSNHQLWKTLIPWDIYKQWTVRTGHFLWRQDGNPTKPLSSPVCTWGAGSTGKALCVHVAPPVSRHPQEVFTEQNSSFLSPENQTTATGSD